MTLRKIIRSQAFCCLLLLTSISPSIIYAQCILPPGAIPLSNSYSSATIPAGSTYYVPTGTTVHLDYSAVGDLTIRGKIIIEHGAILSLKMGNNNVTIVDTVQVCTSSSFNIDTAHDLILNNGTALINIMSKANFTLCHFIHDFNPSAGKIALGDFSAFEIVDYHTFNNADNNIFTYTGSGTTSIGNGNPIVHFGFSGAPGYANINTAASAYTSSNHIDIINDNSGSDLPGMSNYCGILAYGNNLPCRNQKSFHAALIKAWRY